MKKFYEKYKILVCAFVLICAMLGSAMVGLQFFQEEFLALKIVVKDVLYGTEPVVADADTADADVAETATEEEVLPDYRPITINGVDVLFDVAAPNFAWHNVRHMTTEFPNTFVLSGLADFDIWLNGEQVEADVPVEVELDKLAPNLGIPIDLVNKETGAEAHYHIRTLHNGYDINVGEISDDIEDGYYYFTQGDMIYKMNTEGDIVYYLGTKGSAHDFKPYMIDGEVYYSYLEASEGCTDTKLEAVGYNQSRAVIMNSKFEIIDEMPFMIPTDSVPETHSLESHEFDVLGLGHYLTTAYVGKNVENIPTDVDDDGCAYVVACIVQEVVDGEVVFEWDSTNYPELYAYSTEDNEYDNEAVQDYAHINSVDIDPADGNVVMSFRNLDCIIKTDHETAENIWVLGGIGDQFGLTDEQKFAKQHFGKYSIDGILTFYDNGNDKEQTRTVQIDLDEENMTVKDYQTFQVDGKYTWYMGSTQRLESDANRFLIGWGGRTPDHALFSEINFDTGETLFEIYDTDDVHEDCTYRAYKFSY